MLTTNYTENLLELKDVIFINIQNTKKSKVIEFKMEQRIHKCVEMFSNLKQEILEAYNTGLTNGYTDGRNNKIKVLKRNAYGMRDFERFRKRIMHVMSA